MFLGSPVSLCVLSLSSFPSDPKIQSFYSKPPNFSPKLGFDHNSSHLMGGGDGGDGGSGDSATVNVRCSNGSKFSVETPLDSTVEAFKSLVATSSEVPAAQQRLIYKGRILKDDQTLASYGVENEHTIHLVRGVITSTPPSNTEAANINTSGTVNSNPGAARGVGGGVTGEEFGSSLFPGLGVNSLAGSGLFDFPEMDQMQQQLTQNPNMMRELMNLPMIQNMMNNPDLMRNLIMSNPQMREIMDRNPELAHLLNDPSTLRQTIEAARNPELMREMMRNTDRAMSNIESSPEGFNALRRMYETVQEPFLNATAMAGETGNDVGSNPFAALLGTTQSNERLPNPSTTGSEATGGSPVPNMNPLPNPWGNAGRTTASRPTPVSEARSPGISGLGGLGIPDPSVLSQVMQNPAMNQMMQSLISNPQYMNQVFSLNPQLRPAMDSNPQLREMLQNPEFLRQLTNPETLQHLMSLQPLLSQFGRQQPSQGQNPTDGAGNGIPNANSQDFFSNMFSGLGAGGFGVPNTSNVPTEELYATQLSQLQEMGFFDTQENIRALSATAGNVHAAVERLLNNIGH